MFHSRYLPLPPSLPRPLALLTDPGNFSLIGTKMDLMARKMVYSREVCQLVSCSPTQLAVFRFMQKSVNTPSRIKTLDDLIAYILKYRSPSLPRPPLVSSLTSPLLAQRV
jgi:hypothetical protein